MPCNYEASATPGKPGAPSRVASIRKAPIPTLTLTVAQDGSLVVELSSVVVAARTGRNPSATRASRKIEGASWRRGAIAATLRLISRVQPSSRRLEGRLCSSYAIRCRLRCCKMSTGWTISRTKRGSSVGRETAEGLSVGRRKLQWPNIDGRRGGSRERAGSPHASPCQGAVCWLLCVTTDRRGAGDCFHSSRFPEHKRQTANR